MDDRELMKQGSKLGAMVQIGKAGVGPGTLDEVRALLKTRGLVKVKVLPKMGGDDVRGLAQELARDTGSRLLQVKGRTFLLCRDPGR